MLDNLKIFIAVAEQQSLTSGAEHLGMTIATVSRRISELEVKLGCELFHRSNKGLSLTQAGQAYYDETADFVHELNSRLSNLENTLNSLEGELKIMAPTNIGSGPLNNFWRSFALNNPHISLNICLGDPDKDVIANQVDIAIRSGPQQNSSLIQNKLGKIHSVLVVSPDYQNLLPETINQLDFHPSIAAQLFKNWELEKGPEKFVLSKKHEHISNDMNVTLNLVKAGAGIALLPMSIVHEDIKKGKLIQVLSPWEGAQREISLLWPQKRTLSKRALKFKEELIAFLAEQPWFDMTP